MPVRNEPKKFDHAPHVHRIVRNERQIDRQRKLDEKTVRAAEKVVDTEDHGAVVKNIQRHLNGAGYPCGEPNGKMTPRTIAALKAFQRHSKLPATGKVDDATWDLLKKGLIVTRSATSPTQKVGEVSHAVEHTERDLKALGYKSGKADGLFNRKTERAIEKFQRKHHLQVTGEVDRKTMKKLDAAAERVGFGHKAILEARKHVGFREGAGNANPFSRYFGRGGEAWCADFVSYCFSKAGKRLDICNTETMKNHFKANGGYHQDHPKAGDIIFFDWDGGNTDHVGIVEYVRNGVVHTIEGNSGDMCKRNTYPLGSSKIDGYATVR